MSNTFVESDAIIIDLQSSDQGKEFRRVKDTGTWHWQSECSGWPAVDYFTKKVAPDPIDGRLCKQCQAIQFAMPTEL